MSSIRAGTFKDQEALVLENEKARAVLLPAWGAKTVSLVHKGLDIETLWQNPAAAFKKSGYGAPYDTGEFAGFDEMFPTISRCFYEAAPWSGTEAPDHGEVWTVPWDAAVNEDSVTLTVGGTRFPYTLKKTVSLVGEKLVAKYTATNNSAFPLDFLWAAHPLFNAREGMMFVVPAGIEQDHQRCPGVTLGGYGERYDFPRARRADRKEVALDRVPKRNGSGYQKYWFEGKVTEGWCMLHDEKSSLTIGMAFPREKVPYLGMWLNEGGYGGQYNIAPEPATAAMDRIDFAKAWGVGSILPAMSSFTWHLVIGLAAGKLPAGMSPEGDFLAP